MDEPVAVALKFAFLGVLYLFLLWVARSALRDLSRHHDASMVREPPDSRGLEGGAGGAPDLRAGVEPRLVVVAAMRQEPGATFEIGGGATMGRTEGSDIRIDDPFASSAHARIFPRGQFMYIEDMGSTNGTFLNGRQLRSPERLKLADTIRIGETEYRYQE